MRKNEIARMKNNGELTNPKEGRIVWAPVKSIWYIFHTLLAIIGGYLTFSLDAVLVSFLFTVTTLCLGHSIGLHRLLVHRSFECPKWLEYILVHLGTLVGMGGPFKILYMHDIRDWSQRHKECNAYYIHKNKIWKDYFLQIHCDFKLTHPPKFEIEPKIASDKFYQFMEKTWMFQQVPWAILFYLLGGLPYIIWAISVRVSISLLGHWLVGYFAHNAGQRDYHLNEHAVQGYNIPHIALLTMGESFHNNHHAYPESARLGHNRSQPDPGWWMLSLLRSLGLVWNLKLPSDLPYRPELITLANKKNQQEQSNFQTKQLKLNLG